MSLKSELQNYGDLNLDQLEHGDLVKMQIGGVECDVIRISGGLEVSHGQKSVRVFGKELGTAVVGEAIHLRDARNTISGTIGRIRGIIKHKLEDIRHLVPTSEPDEGEQLELFF